MYNFGIVRPDTKKELLKVISDHDVFRYYFGEFTEGEWYNSPFPFRKDSDPSLQISYHDDEWVFRDFGISKLPNDCITFVMWLFNLNYDQALRKIYEDLKDWDKKASTRLVGTRIVVDAGIKLTPWRDFEYEYWAQGGIKKETLKKFRVQPTELWLDGRRANYSKRSSPQFAYVFSIKNKIWKVYTPYADKKKKFFSHNIGSHIQGWDLLPEFGEILFITKSYKDVMVFYEAGYPAIAPHAESVFLAPWEVDILKTRFKHIYVNYDNDETGVTRSLEFTKDHDLKYWNVPLGLSTPDNVVKDPFDLVKIHSYDLLHKCLADRFERDGI